MSCKDAHACGDMTIPKRSIVQRIVIDLFGSPNPTHYLKGSWKDEHSRQCRARLNVGDTIEVESAAALTGGMLPALPCYGLVSARPYGARSPHIKMR